MTHPYAPFVHLVEKPARYLGGEAGARRKDWNAVEARVCLAFPDVYDIGMSHLGFKILYRILNDDPRTLAERAFCPWVDMEKELRARSLPLLSLENARPLCDFDVVGFSLQFELTYTNVLTMLDLGGVPLRSADRGESVPLVIAGGPTATHPEPLSAFVDAFCIGDGEELAKTLALEWTRMRAAGVRRAERLRALARLQGVYVPSLYYTRIDEATGFRVVDAPLVPEAPLPVRRALVEDLNRYPFPDDGPVGGPEAIFDRMSIEIARGCTEGCRFCQAGMIYRPVRERDPEQVVQTLVSAVKKSGYDEVSLTSLSTADYSCIAPLVKRVSDALSKERVSLGVSSLRAYGLGEETLDDLQRVRATGVTFAPEAGSQRMRDVVNKNVTEEQLQETAVRVFSRNTKSMKLYFMIGLPTEEETDVREIVRVGKRARETGRRVWKEQGKAGAPTVTVSVSTHVPKPHTPFQWCAMDPAEVVRKKQEWLREEKRTAGVELRMHDSEGSWLEGVFARGDRTLCDVLETAWRDGARFDSWEDQLNLDVWRRAFEAHGVDPGRFLGTIPVTATLPWSHVDVGLEEGFLLAEYRKALKSRLSPPCGKVAGTFVHPTNLKDAAAETKRLVCYDCGVACDLGAMREERLVYLRKLGAEAPRAAEPRTLPEHASDEPRKKAPPPRIEQGEPRRYRFVYTKAGVSAFLSHLDLIRALPRAFRRAGLPMFYSSGFHPKPDMTFGPALSLGVSSLAEVVDVKLTCDVDPAEWLGRLSEGGAEGVRFLGAVRLGPTDPAVTRVLDAARYVALVPRAALDERGGEAWLRARVDRFLASDGARVLRRIDGIGKWVNVREYVTRLEVGGEGALAEAAGAGFVGDLVPVVCEVEIRGAGGVKIGEVVEVLVRAEGAREDGPADASLPWHAVRTALGVRAPEGIVSPLALGRVRELRAAERAAAREGAPEPLAAEA
jgi:radical SAM family uncharacterized protein/radical SAM-linked protein